MASYHLEAKIIGRSSGRTAIGAAAYRSGSALQDESGEVFDYTRKKGILSAFIMAPDGAPSWTLDRQSLWAAVQAKEVRKNSQLAREIIIALPHELTASEGTELVREWVQATLVEAGMVADIAIHDPSPRGEGDLPNRHAHIMLTTRELDPDQANGWAKNKNRTWNDAASLEGWRESWAAAQNDAFAVRGFDLRVDHRTLVAQREDAEAAGDELTALSLDRDPEPRMGVAAGSLEIKGMVTDRGDALREARQKRAVLEAAVAEARETDLEIMEVEMEIRAFEVTPDSVLGVVLPPVPPAIPQPDRTIAKESADDRDRTRIAVERQLKGLGLDVVEISIIGGDRPTVRLMTSAQVLEDLPRLKRANQAGYDIFIRGPRDRDHDYDHDVILIDDISAFTSKALERDGLKPAVLVQTSPDNYQAWLRLGEPVSTELRQEAALILAQRYGGDIAAANGHQSGRLAGFTNPKPQYRDIRGRSPFVLLHSYAGKAITAVRELLNAARAALAARKVAMASASELIPAPNVDADLVAWWREGHAIKPANASLSEVDWHLTHRALGAGLPPQDVLAALEAAADRKQAHAAEYAALTVRKVLADRMPPPDDDGPSFD